MKKAMFFTLGLTFMAGTVLVLAILIYHNTASTEERFADLGKLERLHDLDSSIQKCLKDIFNNKSGISLSVNNDIVSFEEDLPNGNATSFSNYLNDFKDFVEKNNTNIELNITEITDKLPLVILPQNITYQHENFGGDTIKIIPSQINFKGYEVYVTLNRNVTSCNWDTDPGTFNLTVTAVGTSGSCTDSRLIDAAVTNTVDINGGGVDVDVSDGGQLTINTDYSISLRTDVLLIKTDEQVKVAYKEGTINIVFEELNMQWKGNVRIA